MESYVRNDFILLNILSRKAVVTEEVVARGLGEEAGHEKQ